VVLALNAVGYVVAGWVLTVGGIGAFTVVTLRREKKLSAVVPPEEQRWGGGS
jgi:hypothetical protein